MDIEYKLSFNEIRTQIKGRCISTLGTEWVDNHVQFTSDVISIRESLCLVNEFNEFLDNELDVYEENFFDVRQALVKLRPEKTYLEEIDLYNLKRSLSTINDLIRFFLNIDDDEKKRKYATLIKLSETTPNFPSLINKIDDVLNKYGKVKDTASKELLMIRHQLEVSSRGLSHTLRSIIKEAQDEGFIDRDVTPTIREGRLVIPVSPTVKRKIKGIVHDESASGKTIFIEPTTIVEANNKIRELKVAERREVIRILQELSSLIRPYVSEILKSLQFLARIDYLRAVVSFSKAYDCIVPELISGPHVEMYEARHPLLQQSLQRHGGTIQPLDISLRSPHQILLISGPNAGGKSVCLKTVGLLQYMLQCGLPIPVSERTRVGVFDEIFIDIGDEQSIENELSTYSSHLYNMRKMIAASNAKTLLLIDEFGGGTEPQIGAAIAEGILHQYVKNNTWGVITTHYQNLKHYADSQPIIVNGAMLYDRSQMKPLFVLQIGNPGSSFAIEIARSIGLPNEVIEYASELVGKDYILSDKYLQDIVRDKMYWERKRQNIRSKEKHLIDTVAKYEEEMKAFQSKRKEVMAKAKEEAQNILSITNAQIENTIREIREVQAEKERTRMVRQELSDFKESIDQLQENDEEIDKQLAKIQRRQARRNDKQNQKSELEGASDSTISGVLKTSADAPRISLYVGDYVRIKGQNTIGKIEQIQGKNAKVLFGFMHTNIPLSRLEKSKAPENSNTTKEATFVSKTTTDAMREKQLNFKQDVDLRGMRVDEALRAVAYFIDDAIQVGQLRVRILHGTGTGALRQSIRQYLNTVVGVKSYRDEHVQFGGAGITVVDLD